MAYLPPGLAATRPDSIGHPIPGGSLDIEPVPGDPDGIGELVYRGPNVMLGYAEGPADLALGRTVDELRTGDLGRRGADGLIEVVGRRGGWLKIAGLRIDTEQVERFLERGGIAACAVGTDEELVVATEGTAPADLAATVRDAFGLPSHAVRVAVVRSLPRLPNGKLDRAAVSDEVATTAREPAALPATTGAAALVALYATSLGADEVSVEDTFAGLGGDSLSYIEVSLGLEDALGHLPDGWESMPIQALAALAPPAASAEPGATAPSSWWRGLLRMRSVEMSVVLRAVAIFLIVGTHIGNFIAPGGAPVLMAVAGFNFARFRLTSASREERTRSQLRAVLRIVVPTMIWVALVMLLTDEYELRHLLLINALVRDELWGNLWFIELLVYILLLMTALMAVPSVDRLERRWPFAMAATVLAAGLLFRFGVVDVGTPYTMPVLWLFAIGWAASRAENRWQRAIVLAAALVAVPGYFEMVERNLVILAGLALLIAVPTVRVPAFLVAPLGILAGASLYIYLVHWEVYPLLEQAWAFVALGVSLGAGIGVWLVATRIPAATAGAWAWIESRAERWPLVARRSPRTPAS
jgi:hypothetical protein